MKLIEAKIAEDLSALKSRIETLQQEVERIQEYAPYMSKFKCKWDKRVTGKNIKKTVFIIEVLCSFSYWAEKGDRRITTLRKSTKQIWDFVKLPHGSQLKSAPTWFRNVLNKMKTTGLLNFDDKSRKWTVTEKAMKYLQ